MVNLPSIKARFIKMSCLVFIAAVVACPPSIAQSNQFSLALQVQPAITFHKNNYAYRGKDTYTASTPGIGFETTLQYNLNQKISFETGIGYISRRLKTVVFLNQNVLPPPQQSGTLELVNTKSVSFRTLSIPINLQYKISGKKKFNASVITGIAANYLLNCFYEVENYKKYQGTYKKNTWQGLSINAGMGGDYSFSPRIRLTTKVIYSIINEVKRDEYLFSQDEYVIPLPHTYLQLSFGVRVLL